MQAAADVNQLIAEATQIGPAKVIARVLEGFDREGLASLADQIVSRLDDAVAVLAAEVDGKAAIVCKISEALVEKGLHAGKLVGEVASQCGGRGGGRPNFAQGGAPSAEGLAEAVAKAPEFVRRTLGQ